MVDVESVMLQVAEVGCVIRSVIATEYWWAPASLVACCGMKHIEYTGVHSNVTLYLLVRNTWFCHRTRYKNVLSACYCVSSNLAFKQTPFRCSSIVDPFNAHALHCLRI